MPPSNSARPFFWDIQAGSDGQACASCHFHAGADVRTKNEVNPWFDEAAKANPQHSAFSKRQNTKAGGQTGPNIELGADDFPFKKCADTENRHSKVLYATNDRLSSSGTFAGEFSTAKTPAGPVDEGCSQPHSEKSRPSHKSGYIYRRVEPRNTTANINIIYNFRQFGDGRANSDFNGVTPSGPAIRMQASGSTKVMACDESRS